MNKNNKDYKAYGGAGRGLCSEWKSFENFYNDMGDPPSKLHSIDRIDNSKGYSKDNCRWATPLQQSNNSPRNRKITFNGESLNMSEWGRKLGFTEKTVGQRLAQGWSIKEALTLPLGEKRFKSVHNLRLITYHGETRSVADWSRITGISYYTILMRLDGGWPVGPALAFDGWPKLSKNKWLKHILKDIS